MHITEYSDYIESIYTVCICVYFLYPLGTSIGYQIQNAATIGHYKAIGGNRYQVTDEQSIGYLAKLTHFLHFYALRLVLFPTATQGHAFSADNVKHYTLLNNTMLILTQSEHLAACYCNSVASSEGAIAT